MYGEYTVFLIIPSQVYSVLCDGDVSRHVQLPFKQFQLYNFPALQINRPRSKVQANQAMQAIGCHAREVVI